MRSKLRLDLQILRYIDNFAQQIILLKKGFFLHYHDGYIEYTKFQLTFPTLVS